MYKAYFQFEGPQINQPVIPPPTDAQAGLGTSVPAFILNYQPTDVTSIPIRIYF